MFTASKRPLKYIKKAELQGVEHGIFVKDWPVLSWQLTFQDRRTQNWAFSMELDTSPSPIGQVADATSNIKVVSRKPILVAPVKTFQPTEVD